jgi:hypothetical protein
MEVEGDEGLDAAHFPFVPKENDTALHLLATGIFLHIVWGDRRIMEVTEFFGRGFLFTPG